MGPRRLLTMVPLTSRFGHICVSVDDLDAACKRFEEKGVTWKKRLTDGRMKNVAFILGELVSVLLFRFRRCGFVGARWFGNCW